MTDPIARLRSIADAHVAGVRPDVAVLAGRAGARRRHQLEAVTAVAAGLAVAFVAILPGGPAERRSIVTTTPTPSATSPSASETPTPGGSESASPGSGTSSPEPSNGGRTSPGPEQSPTPTTSPTEPDVVVWASPRVVGPSDCWGPESETVDDPAPFFEERYRDKAAAEPCYFGPATSTSVFSLGSVDAPGERGEPFVAALGVCNKGTASGTLVYDSEQEVELTLATDDRRPVYTWSTHQTFGPVPHSEQVGADDCAVWVWRLRFVDDDGRPLPPGEYWLVLSNVSSQDQDVELRVTAP
jgi:hypothetical protein